MKTTVVHVNLRNVIETYEASPDKVNTAIAHAFENLGRLLLEQALPLTPMSASGGALRRSGEVPPIKLQKDFIEQDVVYGGPAASYAVFVHEMPDPLPSGRPVNWTEPGTQHKFLEEPTLALAEHVPDLIEGDIKESLRARLG